MQQTPLQVFETEVTGLLYFSNMPLEEMNTQIMQALKDFTESLAVQVEAGKREVITPQNDWDVSDNVRNHGFNQAKKEDAAIIRQSIT